MESPCSVSFVLLLGALPGIWLAGLGISRRTGLDPSAGRWVAPAFGLSLWLLAVHALGLLTHSFTGAAFVGTLGVSLLGFWPRPPATFGLEDPPPPSRWIWVGALGAVASLAPAVHRWYIHDDCLGTGHFSIAAQIQNGIYPPRHLSFSLFELRYHYGFDLLSALTSAILRVRIPAAVELLSLLCWGYCFCLLWILGERLLGPHGGPLTASCGLFAGGILAFCYLGPAQPLPLKLMGDCTIDGLWLAPPLGSNFLQHPWTLGLPLGLAILLCLCARLPGEAEGRGVRSGRPRFGDGLALWLLFTVLSFSQIVLFVSLLPAVIVAGAFAGKRLDLRGLGRGLLLGAAVLLAARLCHGFFAQPVEPAGLRLDFSPFWMGNSRRAWAAWTLQSLGLLLPLGVLGWIVLPRQKLLFALLPLGSLAALNLFRYPHSWDMVKFATVAQLSLGILSAAAVKRLWARWFTLPLALLGLVAVTSATVAFEYALGRKLPGIWFCDSLPAAPPEDLQAIAWLRREVGAGEGVYRTQHNLAYTVLGGLPGYEVDSGAGTFGFSAQVVNARTKLLDPPPADSREYLKQGFRWLVLAPGDVHLNPNADRWIREGAADVPARFGELRIVHLRGP